MPRRRNRGNPNRSQPRGKEKVRVRNRREAQRREGLERKWYSRIDFAHQLAPLTVHAAARAEPRHRWLPYRQGFSPQLVQQFLREGRLQPGPVLDPFSGSGVTAIECARLDYNAIALEALAGLAFLTRVRLEADSPAFNPESPGLVTFPEAVKTLPAAMQWAPTCLHRAAVLMAAARTVKGDGRPKKNLPPIPELLDECMGIIREDLKQTFPGGGVVLQGDARELPLADASIGGILTSPPYLSRYDYTRITRPVEDLYRLRGGPDNWQNPAAKNRARQVRAHPRSRQRPWCGTPAPAVKEACSLLKKQGKRKEAGIMQSYFEDLRQVVREGARVLKPGAPLAMVIAGAIFCGVYIPADLVVAEFCEESGLAVEEILMVRNFSRAKRLGSIAQVAPREVILSARKG